MSASGERVAVVHQIPGRVRLRVSALGDYPDAAGWLKQQILMLPGVSRVRIRPSARSAVIHWDRTRTRLAAIIAAIDVLDWQTAEEGDFNTEYCGGDNLLNLAGLALTQVLPEHWARVPALLLTAPTILRGAHTLSQAQLKVEVLDALALSFSLLRGDNRTAMLTQSLLTLGEYLEQETSRHSDALLAELMQPREHPVWVERGGESVEINSSELVVGDVMLLGPGDNIPADGTVLRGVAQVNQASMTGESVPVRCEPGSWVYAGTLIQEGNVAITAEQVGESSSTAHIRRFIRDSLGQRSETQQVMQAMADRRVAITLGVGAAVFAMTQSWRRLASVFLVDYACALKLSTPIAFKSIMYRAAQNGLLLKGGRAIEKLAGVDTVVFDKTGTLTHDDMQVTEVISFNDRLVEAKRLLAMAASVEEHSNHPLANAVVAAAEHHSLPHISHGEVEYVIAHGLLCSLEDHQMVIGSRHFLDCHYDIDFSPYEAEIGELAAQGRHLLFIGFDDRLVGMIGLLDHLRDEAPEVIAQLKASGIRQVVLLTGDRAEKACQLAERVGIDRYVAEATPESKVDVVKALQAAGHQVMFIGDGINDAPVLTQADVGVAMNQSTELAQQAADVVLLQDSLYGVMTARQLSLEAMRLVNSNIKLAEWVNSAIMLSAALGWLTPGVSAILHNGTTIGVLLRSLAAKKGR